MHNFTFARLVKSIMTAAETLSACDVEIEQVHIPVISTLPCLAQLDVIVGLWVLVSARTAAHEGAALHAQERNTHTQHTRSSDSSASPDVKTAGSCNMYVWQAASYSFRTQC